MGDHRPSGATDALGHAQASTLELINTSLASQLLHQLDYLIDPRGSYWIPPRLQPPHGAYRDPAIQGDFSYTESNDLIIRQGGGKVLFSATFN